MVGGSRQKVMDADLAVIGAGQMGEALIKGTLGSQLLEPSQLRIADLSEARLQEVQSKYGVTVEKSNRAAAKKASVIILAVKPNQVEAVVDEIRDVVKRDKVLISIAAGVSTQRIDKLLGKEVPVVRVMPNQPALVGAGVSVISPGRWASADTVTLVRTLFSGVGEVVELDERFQNVATALSGSGPAYFYLFVEVLVEGGIRGGLSREIATKLVTQTLVGAGAVLQETGEHPVLLIDRVASPGGTTAAALAALEEGGFRASVFHALTAAVARAEELG